jgi:hypothetical protein
MGRGDPYIPGKSLTRLFSCFRQPLPLVRTVLTSVVSAACRAQHGPTFPRAGSTSRPRRKTHILRRGKTTAVKAHRGHQVTHCPKSGHHDHQWHFASPYQLQLVSQLCQARGVTSHSPAQGRHPAAREAHAALKWNAFDLFLAVTYFPCNELPIDPVQPHLMCAGEACTVK